MSGRPAWRLLSAFHGYWKATRRCGRPTGRGMGGVDYEFEELMAFAETTVLTRRSSKISRLASRLDGLLEAPDDPAAVDRDGGPISDAGRARCVRMCSG